MRSGLYSASLVALSLIFPEALVAVAAIQFIAARIISQQCKEITGWTPTHSFFVIMGGFFDSSKGDAGDIVHASDITGYDSIIREDAGRQTVAIIEEDILDRSKGDALAKFVVVLQTGWFITQYVGRWADHLPRTQLEVMTLAYAALTLAVYRLWWRKPLKVQRPIDVSKTPRAPSEIRYSGIRLLNWERLPTSEGTDRLLVCVVAPVVAVIFGGVHCFAWSFPFPTTLEAKLWQSCAIFITGAPIIFSLIVYFGTPYTYIVQEFKLKRAGVVEWVILLLVAAYFACRGILFVITFTSLRASPPGVYQLLNWSSFIPHLG